MRSLIVQNTTIAEISEYYQLAKNLRANPSQLVSLQHSPFVQGKHLSDLTFL